MDKPFDFLVERQEDLAAAVERFGIVPLFRGSIPGFSVEEHVSPRAWFSDEEGVWEWKGPVIRAAGCAYGKFFEKKAAFVNREIFPDLANLRRDGYDFDARFDDGLASFADRDLYNYIDKNQPVDTRKLKEAFGGGKRGGAAKKGFETSLARLMAQCYVVIGDFRYSLDRNGRPYGWGIAEYVTPERLMGAAFSERVYAREPEESLLRLLRLLRSLLPDASEKALLRFLR